MDQYSQDSGFMDLLTSQQENQTLTNPFDEEPTVDEQKPKEHRRKWSHTEDVLLIGAWLNTSKDAVVSNDQKLNTFWTRITDYYHASPTLAGVERREPCHCKQRWQKINETVCKFVGSYEAATKAKISGQNEDDVMKLAYDIYSNDHKVKFTLEHAWRELRHDQKCCGPSSAKSYGPSKRRKCDDHTSKSSNSFPVTHEDTEARPIGVKATKAKGKKPVMKPNVEEGGASIEYLQTMWEIRQKEFVLKDKQTLRKENLSKNKMLDSLIAKTEPLTEMEIALKDKLISDLLSS